MSENKQPPIQITTGAVWQKLTKDNRPYVYVKFNLDGKDYCFSAFKNDYKQEGETTPDFRTARPKLTEAQNGNPPQRTTAPSAASRPTVTKTTGTAPISSRRTTNPPQTRTTRQPVAVQDDNVGVGEDNAELL